MKRRHSEKLPQKKNLHSLETDYQIIINSGEQVIQDPVLLRIRGDNSCITIPLTKTIKDEKPFQSNTSHEFHVHMNDIGKIKRITIEHEGKDLNLLWHLKTVQIKKGNEIYKLVFEKKNSFSDYFIVECSFHADVRLDYKENKVNLYPTGAFYGHQKEDYVQSELRRLRENLRGESAKLRAPQQFVNYLQINSENCLIIFLSKAHQPFVFNDLSPYFDTSPVERAIYSVNKTKPLFYSSIFSLFQPLDAPPGYYTRLTALRVVEPWEAYGMDYGVNYEFLKQRNARSLSAKRP